MFGGIFNDAFNEDVYSEKERKKQIQKKFFNRKK